MTFHAMRVKARALAGRWPEGLLLAFAFFYNFPCGLRVLEGTDSTHYFDGAFRILSGQIPYRDFYSPTGPLIYVLTAMAFGLFGVSYPVYVGVAALMNIVITACVLAGARALGVGRHVALAAGLATAIWNLPIERGTPWYDPAAFIFLHVAVWLLLAPPARPAVDSAWMAGLALAGAFYGKQSTGAIGAAALTLFLLQTGPRARAVRLAAAFLIGVLGFAACLMILGHPAAVLRYLFFVPLGSGYLEVAARGFSPWLAIPLALAGWRLSRPGERVLGTATMLFLSHAASTRLVSTYYFLPLLALPFLEQKRDRALLSSLVVIQYGSRILSQGETYTYWTFIGLMLVVLYRAVEPASRTAARRLGYSMMTLGSRVWWSVLVLVLLMGVRYGLLRKLSYQWQMFSVFGPLLVLAGSATGSWLSWRAAKLRDGVLTLLAGGAFGLAAVGARQTVTTLAAKRVHWERLDKSPLRMVRVPGLEPLRVSPSRAEALEELYVYLAGLPAEARPFFIYPSYLIFYGLLAQESPQPFLWFAPGLSYASGSSDEHEVCASLKTAGVRTVVAVAEEPSVGELTPPMPCLAEWMSDRFRFDRRFGIFRVYRIKAGASAGLQRGSRRRALPPLAEERGRHREG